LSHCGTCLIVEHLRPFVAYRSCPDFIPRFTISRSFGLAAHASHMRPPSSLFATSTATAALVESRTLPRFSHRTLVFRRASSGHSFQGDSPRFPRETARSRSFFHLSSSRASAPPVLRLVLWFSVGAFRSSFFQSAGVSVVASFFSTCYSLGFTSAIPSLSLGLSASFEKSSSLACGGGLLLVLQVCSCTAKLTRLSATDFKSFLRW
jgi:hypothetical protein